MDPKGVRNMYSLLVIVNKHNTARVASCWFIIYYRIETNFTHKVNEANQFVKLRKQHIFPSKSYNWNPTKQDFKLISYLVPPLQKPAA